MVLNNKRGWHSQPAPCQRGLSAYAFSRPCWGLRAHVHTATEEQRLACSWSGLGRPESPRCAPGCPDFCKAEESGLGGLTMRSP